MDRTWLMGKIGNSQLSVYLGEGEHELSVQTWLLPHRDTWQAALPPDNELYDYNYIMQEVRF